MISHTTFDFLFQWHLTERCNLQCTHCYQSGNSTQEFTADECRNVINEVAEMLEAWEKIYAIKYLPSFNISGGEPLLSEHLFQVAEELASKDFEWYLLTNGTLVTVEVAKQLKRQRVAGVQVSLEGPRDIHDAIRGEGTYDAAVKGIRQLLAEGIMVIANMTLSQMNAQSMELMIFEMKKLGVQRLGFSRMVPMGRATEIAGLFEQEAVKKLYTELMAKKEPGLELVTGDPLAMQLRHKGQQLNVACGGCAAGVSGLTLRADGIVVPCRRLDIPIGNVRSDSLREIWATSDILTRLRTRECYNSKCGSCSRWATCRGCRAVAYGYSRLHGGDDYLADDPSCFIHDSSLNQLQS